MLSYYMYLVFSQVLCLIQIFYQILPKQNSIRGQTIRQSDWCGDTISSKRSFFLNTKAHLTPFWKRKTTKILGGFGLSHSATWVAQSTCHQPKHPKRILQNSSAQISHPLKTASPLPSQLDRPPTPAWGRFLCCSWSLLVSLPSHQVCILYLSKSARVIQTHCWPGYQWEPVHSDSFPWRPCSSFEATKKNCPKGEPCMADLRWALL